jgi:hypothetical protein
MGANLSGGMILADIGYALLPVSISACASCSNALALNASLATGNLSVNKYFLSFISRHGDRSSVADCGLTKK